MLYTSYFGNLNRLPKTCITVAICAKPPSWYTGLCCKSLAPSYHCLMDYKHDGDIDKYTKRYTQETLGKLKVQQLLQAIYDSLPDSAQSALRSDSCEWYAHPVVHVVFLCFEKPGSFCHRNIFAEWLKSSRVEIKEWV